MAKKKKDSQRKRRAAEPSPALKVRAILEGLTTDDLPRAIGHVTTAMTAADANPSGRIDHVDGVAIAYTLQSAETMLWEVIGEIDAALVEVRKIEAGKGKRPAGGRARDNGRKL